MPILSPIFSSVRIDASVGFREKRYGFIVSALLLSVREGAWHHYHNYIYIFLKFPLTKPVERQIPYTLYGLAAATGYAPQRVLELAKGGGAAARMLRQAVHRIGAYTMERALLGELPHQVALTALSALEGKEAAVDGIVSITMDDAAAKWAE